MIFAFVCFQATRVEHTPPSALPLLVPRDQRRQLAWWNVRPSQLTALELLGYVPRLIRHYRMTASILTSHAVSRKPIDVSSTLLDLFFDVISDLTFGQSFNTQTTKQQSPIVVEFLSKQKALGFALLNMPLLHLAKNMRMSVKKQKSWEGWYDEALNARSKVSQPSSDEFLILMLMCEEDCFDVGHIHISVAIQGLQRQRSQRGQISYRCWR